MATIYFYVRSSKLNETLRYGIKLSQNFSHKIPIKGIEKKCMVGLLNPKDDLSKFNSDEFVCLKLNLYAEQCHVINEVSLVIPPKEYETISLQDYRYGEFESPRVLFCCSILPEEITILNKTIDEPLLFDNSKDLYYQIKITQMMDELEPSEVYFALCEYIDYKESKALSNLENSFENKKL